MAKIEICTTQFGGERLFREWKETIVEAKTRLREDVREPEELSNDVIDVVSLRTLEANSLYTKALLTTALVIRAEGQDTDFEELQELLDESTERILAALRSVAES